MGLCRTWVFAREDSEPSILEALREGRTVVLDGGGNAFGDHDLIDLTRQNIRFTPLRSSPTERDWLSGVSRTAGLLGLLGVFLFASGRAAMSRQLTSAK
jgi:hypothetical protein